MAEGSAREAVFLARADVRGDGGEGNAASNLIPPPLPSFLPPDRMSCSPGGGHKGGAQGTPILERRSRQGDLGPEPPPKG